MSSLAVLTPSYAPDLELCCDLNRSVLEWTQPEVRHYIIVPRRDVDLFARLRGPRTEVRTVAELLPRSILAVPKTNVWLNVRRPYPPVRGWVMQQVVKLLAAAELGVDVVLLADSDVVFVRPVSESTFRKDGRLRFHRAEDAVDESMRRHVTWHRVAHRLLGLPPAARPPLTDYVSALNLWDRKVVLGLRDRVERVTGRFWLDAITSQPHVSEFILYGVFVDAVLGVSADVFPARSMLCHSYWDPVPLTRAAAADFVGARSLDDVAVMISAKSHTPLDVRRAALSGISHRAPQTFGGRRTPPCRRATA